MATTGGQDFINAIVEEEIHLRRFGNVTEGQSHMQQHEIDVLWQQDRDSLATATTSLRQTDSLTSKMMDTLQSFDGRVSRLLTNINQVQDKTTKWKTIHTNINKSLTSIEEILNKFQRIDLARRVVNKGLTLQAVYEKQKEEAHALATESALDSDLDTTEESGTFGSDDEHGPNEFGKDDAASSTMNTESGAEVEPSDPTTPKNRTSAIDLDTYLLHLDSIVELEKFFQENQRFKSAPEALSDLQVVSVSGMEHIYRFYDALLLSNVQPLHIQTKASTVKIRRGKEDLLHSSIQEAVMDPRAIIQLVTEPVIRDLLKLIKRLQVSNIKVVDETTGTAKSYLQIYIDRRTQFIVDTLRSSFNEATLFSAYTIEDRSAYQFNLLSSSKLRAIPPSREMAFGREKGLISGVAHLLHADKVEQKRKLREVMNTSVTYEKGSHLFLLFTEVQLVLLRSERTLAETLIPSKSQVAVFTKIATPALAFWYEMAEALLRSLKKNPNKVYGISVLLDMYGTLKQLLKLYEQLLTGCPQTDELTSVTTFWTKLTSAGRQAFQQFRDDVKADPIRSLPTDATVHELTSATINYLRHLFEYMNVVVELLPPLPSTTKRSPLADYIVAVLGSLKDNLDEKARKEKKAPALANVFLLNNYYFVWRSVANSELSTELGQRGSDLYRGWSDEQKEVYRNSLTSLLDHLNDEKYKEKDRLAKKTIKSRFKGFNDMFEDLFKTQSAFYIPDDELREQMRKELRQRILPPYRSFLDRYNDVPFTKNKGKYVKYSPEVLESSLNKFFGGATAVLAK